MRVLLVFLALIGFVGCSSISTLHDAKTTKKGEMSHRIAVGQIGAKVTANGASGVSGDVDAEVSIPQVDYMFRYGLTDSFDFGLRTSGMSHGVDGKYNLIDGDFAMSLGLALMYMTYESTSGSGTTQTKASFTSMDIVVPVYLSYYFAETFALYVVPKYLQRSVTGGDESVSVGYTGASVGIKWGKEWGLILEYTMLTGSDPDTKDSISMNQTAVGLFF